MPSRGLVFDKKAAAERLPQGIRSHIQKLCRGTGKRTFEICFQQVFVARENDVRFGMDRGAENGAVVCVAHLFFGSIGGFGNGYDFQHQHGDREEGFERLNFMW